MEVQSNSWAYDFIEVAASRDEEGGDAGTLTRNPGSSPEELLDGAFDTAAAWIETDGEGDTETLTFDLATAVLGRDAVDRVVAQSAQDVGVLNDLLAVENMIIAAIKGEAQSAFKRPSIGFKSMDDDLNGYFESGGPGQAGQIWLSPALKTKDSDFVARVVLEELGEALADHLDMDMGIVLGEGDVGNRLMKVFLGEPLVDADFEAKNSDTALVNGQQHAASGVDTGGDSGIVPDEDESDALEDLGDDINDFFMGGDSSLDASEAVQADIMADNPNADIREGYPDLDWMGRATEITIEDLDLDSGPAVRVTGSWETEQSTGPRPTAPTETVTVTDSVVLKVKQVGEQKYLEVMLPKVIPNARNLDEDRAQINPTYVASSKENARNQFGHVKEAMASSPAPTIPEIHYSYDQGHIGTMPDGSADGVDDGTGSTENEPLTDPVNVDEGVWYDFGYYGDGDGDVVLNGMDDDSAVASYDLVDIPPEFDLPEGAVLTEIYDFASSESLYGVPQVRAVKYIDPTTDAVVYAVHDKTPGSATFGQAILKTSELTDGSLEVHSIDEAEPFVLSAATLEEMELQNQEEEAAAARRLSVGDFENSSVQELVDYVEAEIPGATILDAFGHNNIAWVQYEDADGTMRIKFKYAQVVSYSEYIAKRLDPVYGEVVEGGPGWDNFVAAADISLDVPRLEEEWMDQAPGLGALAATNTVSEWATNGGMNMTFRDAQDASQFTMTGLAAQGLVFFGYGLKTSFFHEMANSTFDAVLEKVETSPTIDGATLADPVDETDPVDAGGTETDAELAAEWGIEDPAVVTEARSVAQEIFTRKGFTGDEGFTGADSDAVGWKHMIRIYGISPDEPEGHITLHVDDLARAIAEGAFITTVNSAGETVFASVDLMQVSNTTLADATWSFAEAATLHSSERTQIPWDHLIEATVFLTGTTTEFTAADFASIQSKYADVAHNDEVPESGEGDKTRFSEVAVHNIWETGGFVRQAAVEPATIEVSVSETSTDGTDWGVFIEGEPTFGLPEDAQVTSEQMLTGELSPFEDDVMLYTFTLPNEPDKTYSYAIAQAAMDDPNNLLVLRHAQFDSVSGVTQVYDHTGTLIDTLEAEDFIWEDPFEIIEEHEGERGLQPADNGIEAQGISNIQDAIDVDGGFTLVDSIRAAGNIAMGSAYDDAASRFWTYFSLMPIGGGSAITGRVASNSPLHDTVRTIVSTFASSQMRQWMTGVPQARGVAIADPNNVRRGGTELVSVMAGAAAGTIVDAAWVTAEQTLRQIADYLSGGGDPANWDLTKGDVIAIPVTSAAPVYVYDAQNYDLPTGQENFVAHLQELHTQVGPDLIERVEEVSNEIQVASTWDLLSLQNAISSGSRVVDIQDAATVVKDKFSNAAYQAVALKGAATDMIAENADFTNEYQDLVLVDRGGVRVPSDMIPGFFDALNQHLADAVGVFDEIIARATDISEHVSEEIIPAINEGMGVDQISSLHRLIGETSAFVDSHVSAGMVATVRQVMAQTAETEQYYMTMFFSGGAPEVVLVNPATESLYASGAADWYETRLASQNEF